MAGNKYLAITGNSTGEVAAIQSSAGAGDAGKIPALDAGGLLDATMMPAGVGANTKALAASEALAAGDFVNIWDDTGTTKMRKADASTSGKEAHGFVLASVESAATGTCYLSGVNNQLTGLTGGTTYFLSASVPGGVVDTVPSSTGNVMQRLGTADSTTELPFQPGDVFVRA